MQTRPELASGCRLMLGGDVMLGRMVGDAMLRLGSDYPLAPVAALLRQGDLAMVNLECAITATTHRWPGAPKAFYFCAPPQAAQTLADARITLVSLANNHMLDFGVAGLFDTLRHLNAQGIRYAGAGATLQDATAPVMIDCRGIRFGMAAFCDHQADFAAQQNSPGIAYLDLDDEFAAVAVLRKALEPLRSAAVDWPILSLHWGPNMVLRPSIKFRRLAHAAVNMGWKILLGHSAHVFQGIEIYQGCPIIYAAGDLVDDYYVDPYFKNDRQLLFEIELDRNTLRCIRLHPLLIKDCQTQFAAGEDAESAITWMQAICREMGTLVQREGRKYWIAGTGL